MVRVCDDAGRCRHVTLAQVRRALLPIAGRANLASEMTASAATNRRELNALLARLR